MSQRSEKPRPVRDAEKPAMLLARTKELKELEDKLAKFKPGASIGPSGDTRVFLENNILHKKNIIAKLTKEIKVWKKNQAKNITPLQ